MQSGSASQHNRAYNYCSYTFIYPPIFPTLPSHICAHPSLTSLPRSLLMFLPCCAPFTLSAAGTSTPSVSSLSPSIHQPIHSSTHLLFLLFFPSFLFLQLPFKELKLTKLTKKMTNLLLGSPIIIIAIPIIPAD